MSNATKTLINTTVKIVGLGRDSLQRIVLDILASNPTVVYGAMGVTELGSTYKVVVTAHGSNKIGLIKQFREVCGAGLADSKGWTEGVDYTFGNLPAGVFAHGKSKDEADALAAKINEGGVAGLRVMVLRDDVPYTYTANWAGVWAAGT